MSEKHLPKHVRSSAKELKAALLVIQYLQSQNALYPSANIHVGDLAGVIGVGMGTVRQETVDEMLREREAGMERTRERVDDILTD